MTQVTLPASYVSKLLKEEATTLFAKRMIQLTYDLSSAIRVQVIKNADATFNKTQRENSKGKAQAGSKGSLRNSVSIIADNGRFGVQVGGPSAPYAAIHEYGGIITPKNAKYLTVPAGPKYVGKRAREFDLQFIQFKSGAKALVLKSALEILAGRKNVGGKLPKDAVAFWLRDSVTMPKRPYIEPAIQEVLSNAKWVSRIVQTTGGKGLPWSVE